MICYFIVSDIDVVILQASFICLFPKVPCIMNEEDGKNHAESAAFRGAFFGKPKIY